jgi:uncharacterized protein YbbC (DUF1343 family)
MPDMRQTATPSQGRQVTPGISVLLADRRDLIAGRRVGVLTNHSAVLPDLTSTADALLAVAEVRALFSPEHGFHGAAAEGVGVADEWHRAGVPIYSLYGANLAPAREQLAGLDVIVCDLQDIGCRFYTYAWTVAQVMQAAARAGVALVVADRPNPIGGAIEGPGVAPEHRTLVGLHDVPIRHGMTLGELMRLVDREWGCGADLTVVPCVGWRHSLFWEATGLPWAPPSPHMPTPATALLYPGTCLLEGVKVSVGRGTARPFEWLGAPWIDGEALARALNDLALPGVRWRPVQFQPCAGPFAGEVCRGVQPHVTDRRAIRPVAAGVGLVAALWRLHPAPFAAGAAFDAAHFDRLAGSAHLRAAIMAGAAPEEIAAGWRAYERDFAERSAPVRLYA